MGNVCAPPKEHAKLEVEHNANETAPGPTASRRRSGVSAEVVTLAHDPNAPKRSFPKTDEERARLAGILRNIFLFQDADDDTLSSIIDAMKKEVVKKSGHVVISQGDLNAEFFYIIDQGECEISKDGKVLVTIGAGKYFGELALMYNAPRAATVKTAAKLNVFWALDRETFHRVRVSLRAKQLSDAEKFLKEVPFLKPMSASNLSGLADVLSVMTFENGQTIIKQGDPGDRMYIVEKGEAVATVTKSGGNDEVIKNYSRGTYFGELALLHNQPRAANVVAKGRCTTLSMDKLAFDRLLGDVSSMLEANAKAYPALYDKYVVAERRASQAQKGKK